MIAVEVGYKDVRDPASPDLVPDHLDLRAFAAINEQQVPVDGNDLAGRVTVKSWYRRVVAEDRDSEHERIYKFSPDCVSEIICENGVKCGEFGRSMRPRKDSDERAAGRDCRYRIALSRRL
jgi:hypothetical protein